MQNISFGNKIPVATCQVQNKTGNRFEESTIFEYTCKDRHDLAVLNENAELNDWQYGFCIYAMGHNKYSGVKRPERETRIYIMEDKEGNIIGQCCAEKTKDDLSVKYIETKHKKDEEESTEYIGNYRYCGQAILGMLAKMAMNENTRRLVIKCAQENALDFYQNICGFHYLQDGDYGTDLFLYRDELPKLIRSSENNTQREIDLFV